MKPSQELELSQFDGLSADQQRRLTELLDGYLTSLEKGERPSKEQLLKGNEDLLGPLETYLESLEFLQDAAAGFGPASRSLEFSEDGENVRRQVGDFQVVREVGRGGMGIVYEAHQVSLNRRVALKVLPFAALLDSKQIARFRHEAQAAAQLHHESIVPVFAIGTEDGVNYYAMQFIEGLPLDRVIALLRHPDFSQGDGDSHSVSSSPSPSEVSSEGRWDVSTELLPDAATRPASDPHEPEDAPERTSDREARRTQPASSDLPSEKGQPPTMDAGAARAASWDQEGTDGPPSAGPEATADESCEQSVDSARMEREEELLRELRRQFRDGRRDYFVTVARIGIQAAEALHAAHEVGIVHRDVKPSNLMLEPEGKLWITDFGLARCRTDVDLTRSGDFIGTMRYMSPEQTKGKSHLVDHRVDVYSLGLTIYELLTLRHAVRGEDPAAILRQLDREQPYRPRVLNPHIPPALENVVLKAIAKSRDDRYESAQDLADDLRRFVDGKPTVARPPSLFERLTKWVGRHKPIVAAAMIALTLIAAGTSVSSVLLDRQKRAAERNYRKYRSQLAVSRNNQGMLNEQAGDVAKAIAFYHQAIELQRETLDEQPNEEEAARWLATSLRNLARLESPTDPEQAAHRVREAVRIQRGWVDRGGTDPVWRMELALTLEQLGQLHQQSGELDLASECLHESVAMLRESVDTSTGAPLYPQELAIALSNVATLEIDEKSDAAAEERLVEARELLRGVLGESSQAADAWSSLGVIESNLGVARDRQGKPLAAAESHRQSVDCLRRAVELAPSEPQHKELLISCLRRTVYVLPQLDRWEEAQALIAELGGLRASDPRHLLRVATDLALLSRAARSRVDEFGRSSALAEADGFGAACVRTLQRVADLGADVGQLIRESDEFRLLQTDPSALSWLKRQEGTL